MKYFHGGVKGLKIGGIILAPEITLRFTLGHYVSDEDKAAGHSRGDQVYITTDVNAARVYASMWPGGDVYQVEPIGEMENDLDAVGVSFVCDSARIISVVQRNVKFKIQRLDKMMQL
jgi:hypothetical protein